MSLAFHLQQSDSYAVNNDHLIISNNWPLVAITTCMHA